MNKREYLLAAGILSFLLWGMFQSKHHEKVKVDMDRRSFLQVIGSAATGIAGSMAAPMVSHAQSKTEDKEFYGILVDTTRCIGCRSCEVACAEVNDLPVPDMSAVLDFTVERETTETQWTVINRYETEKGQVYVPKRCMHCNQAACVAACLVKAMEKRKSGHVTWDTNCMGCRLCMVSCPFDIPKFEYNSALPKIQKCTLCWDRFKDGKLPGCVEACPTEALIFGTRRQLLEEAKRRIYQNPGKYNSHIYGEHEAGGTSHLYLSSVPFDQIGFRSDIGNTPYPEFSKGFLYAVPFVFVLWPVIMLGMNRAIKGNEKTINEGQE
ncbi:MAG: 4Fe-4S dicluster domain-containing protein [Deltaproteobacteria bacterium]|nr:4Fe-4S dicluster domain-containing protein [Deltaproteobacteria bacterium]